MGEKKRCGGEEVGERDEWVEEEELGERRRGG